VNVAIVKKRIEMASNSDAKSVVIPAMLI
ncbi:hypothetical protein SAMN05421852_13910, partial [Thermoflavimicrobium dichotomicum]